MASNDARDYVLAYENDKPEAARIAHTTAEKLQSKQYTLIEVVQSIGEYVNDENENIRGRAVSYLTATIGALPPKYLSRQQIQVLNQFFCDRIQDGGAIEGLSQLQGLERFNNEMAQTVVKAIFEHFMDLQTRNQAARFKVLQLLNELMTVHRKAVRDMQEQSLQGIIDLVAGEKDPRNLMLIFSMVRVLMVEWDITNHAETLFDSVYAYFPITFRPPPNDPYGITAQDLKDRLKECLAASGALAPYAIPNLLDKLDSTSETVKKDVLTALTAIANNYGAKAIAQYSITLWDAVKFEILQAQEPFLADQALLVLNGMATTLSKSDNPIHGSTASPLLHYLKPVTKECLEHIHEPASRQAKASGDILKAVASASYRSFEVVIKAVGPQLLTIHQASEGIVQQRAVLEITNQIFEAALDVYGSWTSPKATESSEMLFAEFKDKFVAIYSRALMGTVKEEVSFRLTAAKGLLLFSKIQGLLADNEIGMFVQYFNEIVLVEETYGRDELKRLAMNALAEISRFKPRLISDVTFPAFLARLPDSEEQANETKGYQAVLEGLAEISTEKELLETLVRRLLNKLDLLFQSEGAQYPYTCGVLAAIQYVLARSATSGTRLDAYFDRIVRGMSQKSTEATNGPLTNEVVLDLVGRIANLVARYCSAEKIQIVADNIYSLFRTSSMEVDSRSIALQDSLTQILSMWLLAALPRSTQTSQLSPESLPTLIKNLASLASRSQAFAVSQSSLKQITLLVNKHLANNSLATAEDLLSETFNALERSKPVANAAQSIRLLFSLIKGLTLRLSPKTSEHLARLINLLDSSQSTHDTSKHVALGFSTILSHDEVLTKDNFAQIRMLVPQKVFQIIVPMISSKFREAQPSENKENYLIALSGVLGTVPSEIVMPELPILLPLLLQSLDIADQSVKVATLETIAVVISTNPTALEESGHIPALVKRIIVTGSLPKKSSKPSQNVAVNGPRARRLATRCLTLMPKYITGGGSRANPLLSLKKEVLAGLAVVLDDPKRDVRKEGVDARGAWIRGVDDPEEDEE